MEVDVMNFIFVAKANVLGICSSTTGDQQSCTVLCRSHGLGLQCDKRHHVCGHGTKHPSGAALQSIFITGCVCSAYACYNRRSFGLLANSVFLIIIDGIGLIRYFIVT
jgi:hypothetical protein